jgi:hypothetical protein
MSDSDSRSQFVEPPADGVWRTEVRSCQDCGVSYDFTAGEQQFFAAHKLRAPRRCPPCRKVERARHAQQGETNGNRNGIQR